MHFSHLGVHCYNFLKWDVNCTHQYFRVTLQNRKYFRASGEVKFTQKETTSNPQL